MTDNTLLLRQVHPTFVQQGAVTSQAFRPTIEHDWKLSVYDGDQIEAKPSWEHYTTVQQKESAGVLGVAVIECVALDLPVAASPEVFREHCDIDFAGLPAKLVDRKGKLLRDRATARGWLYQVIS